MKKKFLTLFLAFVLFLVPVYADEITETSSKKQVIKAGDSVTLTDTVDGSTLLAGNNVNYSGDTNGALLLAGNNIDVKGISKYAFIVGNNVIFNGDISQDAFIVGNSVTINSNFERDVMVAASTVKLSGEISRDVTIYAANVTFDDVVILGDVKVVADNITITSNVVIEGNLDLKSSQKEISGNASIASINYEEVTFSKNALNEVKSKAISYASLLLVFVVIALVFPKSFDKVGLEDTKFLQIITYIGYALVFLVLAPIAILMLALLAIGLPLALMAFACYILVIYLSYAYAGYYIGRKIYLKTKKTHNVLLEGLIGITLLYLLSLIPIVGNIITMLAYLLGLGVIIFNFKK